MDTFAELNCLSNFSFLKGASHPEELVQQAVALGYTALAITDECSVAGVVKAWQEARKYPHFQLIIGSEFHYRKERFVVIAPHREAYSELCQLITHCRRQASKGDYVFTPDDLIHLCPSAFLLWAPSILSPSTETDWHTNLITAFQSRLWLQLVLTLEESDISQRTHIGNLSLQWSIPIIASSRALMHCATRKMLQDCLSAIYNNQSVHSIKARLAPNAENHLRRISRLKKIYSASEIANTVQLAQRCTFTLNEIAYQYPKEVVPAGRSASEYLRELSYQGACERYRCRASEELPEKIRALLEKELSIIAELAYESYFLTLYDIVSFARSQNILCQGRGSAANSAVCYCLGITAVDPMRASLLFERFISKRRNEPPDIDVDFENDRREEVIQYIYEKYGRDRCAIAATVITYRPKSAIRDLGKALGVELTQLENVIANYGWRYRSKNWIDDVITPAISKDSHVLQCFKKLLPQLLGFPRHLSQHVGGFVITEQMLTSLVPIENARMPNRTLIQWDKKDLEALGLMKVDLLALGMLSALQKTLSYISQRKGETFEINDIPDTDDPAVYAMLQKADSVGLFQVESRAQMNMLPRLKPEKYYDLVVQVAIVRPGPIHGDMVHPYLKRKNGIEPADVPLPELEPVLGRTYGVPIFQEQVIAMAMVAAQFSADEAEELRRSMASWKQQGHMNQLRQKMSQNLMLKGVSTEYVERICRQIEGFGEYGFPESHAASFALIAYASAWLKHYYPAEFCCGLLNSQPMGFYQPWQLLQDIQNHAVEILPIDINASAWDHRVIYGSNDNRPKIRLGFRLVKGLKESTINTLFAHRPTEGFPSYEAVMSTPNVCRDTLEKLASANAFTSFGEHRYQQRWRASSCYFYNHLYVGNTPNNTTLRAPDRIEEIQLSYASTQIVLNDHPVAYLRDHGLLQGCVSADELTQLAHDSEIYVAGLVINRQRPKTSAGVTFVTLEDETGSINLVIWLQTAIRQMETLVKARFLKVYGRIDKDPASQITHIIAYRLFDISHIIDKLAPQSRDFH
ncbi:MAG: error-prone DNA polymerase [Hahellaceae bacterium]|nr:error-prone DNA polymerase [Hahellaceae bacterium]